MTTFTFPQPKTEIIDRYVVSIPVPATDREAAHEVTHVTVSLLVADEDLPEEGLKAGEAWAEATLSGHRITKAGKRHKGGGNASYGRIFGVRDDETRYEIARQATLASLARHQINPTTVVGLDLRPWEEVQAAKEADMLAQFGITPKEG